MVPVYVHIGAAAPYSLLLIILYIAGVYLGSWSLYLFAFLLTLPVLSLIHLILTSLFLRLNQDFSTNHPVKGQEFIYTITVVLESKIPGSWINIRYKQYGKEYGAALKDVTFFALPGEPFHKEYTIHCPFRGIYTLGLESLEVRDFLGWISYRMPVWHRTFYVYPRLIKLDRLKIDSAGDITRYSGNTRGDIVDYTLTKTVTEYRAGENIRHMAWKKFAATGQAYLREYDQTSWPGITLYLDTRRLRKPNYTLLKAEDCSVEITVALLHYFLLHEVPVYLRTGHWGLQAFFPDDTTALHRFIEATINLYFKEEPPWGISPDRLLTMDMERNALYTAQLLLITHMYDSGIAAFLMNANPAGINASAIVNLTSFSEEEKIKASSFSKSFFNTGSQVLLVSNPEGIREDLSTK